MLLLLPHRTVKYLIVSSVAWSIDKMENNYHCTGEEITMIRTALLCVFQQMVPLQQVSSVVIDKMKVYGSLSDWGQRRISTLSPFLFSVSNRNLHISTTSCVILLDFWRFPVCSRKNVHNSSLLLSSFVLGSSRTLTLHCCSAQRGRMHAVSSCLLFYTWFCDF